MLQPNKQGNCRRGCDRSQGNVASQKYNRQEYHSCRRHRERSENQKHPDTGRDSFTTAKSQPDREHVADDHQDCRTCDYPG